MSSKTNQKLTEYGKTIVFEAIKEHSVRYTNASDDRFIRHSYTVNCPEVYISTLKVADKTHLQSAKYMLNITFKKEANCQQTHDSNELAKKIYTDLREKYEQAIKRTRLTRNFQNPSFAVRQK